MKRTSINMRAFLLRFFEISVPEVLLSLAATALFKSGWFLLSVQNCTKVLVIINILFIAFNVIRMRQCFFEMRDRVLFYIINYAAYAVFIAINIGLLARLTPERYTWFFAAEKRWSTACSFSISNYASAVMSHFIMLVAIMLAPLGMSWVFETDDEEEEAVTDEFDDCIQ